MQRAMAAEAEATREARAKVNWLKNDMHSLNLYLSKYRHFYFLNFDEFWTFFVSCLLQLEIINFGFIN